MEVGAPRSGVGEAAGEGLVEVVGAAQSGRGGGAGLVEEAGFVEGGEGLADLGPVGFLGVQGGGELGLDDADAARLQGAQRPGGVLEGGGEVAGVEADADAVGGGVAERGEGGDGVGGGLDGAARFGLQADADGAAGEVGEGVEPFGESGEGAQRGAVAAAVVVGAPGEGKGGDGALGDVVGEQGGEEAGEVGGVGEAGALGPVGPVDAVLDLGLAESLVGEAVEGDDLEAAPVEVAAEGAQGGGVGDEGGGRVAGEPQPDAEPVAAQALADGLAVVAELARTPSRVSAGWTLVQ